MLICAYVSCIYTYVHACMEYLCICMYDWLYVLVCMTLCGRVHSVCTAYNYMYIAYIICYASTVLCNLPFLLLLFPLKYLLIFLSSRSLHTAQVYQTVSKIQFPRYAELQNTSAYKYCMHVTCRQYVRKYLSI